MSLKAEVGDAPVSAGTPVPKKTMLVVGATGTLGRQVHPGVAYLYIPNLTEKSLAIRRRGRGRRGYG